MPTGPQETVATKFKRTSTVARGRRDFNLRPQVAKPTENLNHPVGTKCRTLHYPKNLHLHFNVGSSWLVPIYPQGNIEILGVGGSDISGATFFSYRVESIQCMANPFVKDASVRAPCAWAGQPLAFSEPLIPPTTGTAGRIPLRLETVKTGGNQVWKLFENKRKP